MESYYENALTANGVAYSYWDLSADPALPLSMLTATAAFTDDSAVADALTVAAGPYKVVFLAFPFEAYGTAVDKADLMHRVLAYLG